MRLLVASDADEASQGQRRALLDLASWSEDEPFEGRATWSRGDMRLVTVVQPHLYRDDLDRAVSEHFGTEPSLVVYLSKHRAESATPSLTVHPIGNLGAADYGGRAKTLVPASAQWMTAALRGLRREATGLCTAGDVRLVPMQIDAEGRAASISTEEAADVLERVPDLEPPFLRLEGRVAPEWLEHLLESH